MGKLGKHTRNQLEKILNKRGYGLVALDFQIEKIHENNFNNLAKAYEFVFSKYFHQITDNDSRFSYLRRLQGTPPSMAYFIADALERTKNISGDVCEFGVAQGETSALIANEIRLQNKILHLFDSFEGLPKPSKQDVLKDDVENLGNIEAYEGAMKSPRSTVLERLSDIKFPSKHFVIHEGFIEKLINAKKDFPKKVSFAYVDMDFYEPIKVALNFLDKVTVKGSIIIVDEYDRFSTGSKIAIDEFIKEQNKTKKRYDCFVPDKVFGHFIILTRI